MSSAVNPPFHKSQAQSSLLTVVLVALGAWAILSIQFQYLNWTTIKFLLAIIYALLSYILYICSYDYHLYDVVISTSSCSFLNLLVSYRNLSYILFLISNP